MAVYLLQVSRLLAQLSLPVRQARNVLEGGGKGKGSEGLRLAAWLLGCCGCTHLPEAQNADNGARGVTPRRGREEDLEAIALWMC